MLRLSLIIIIFSFASCTINPYRATLGSSVHSTRYSTSGEDNETKKLCVDGKASEDSSSSLQCPDGGLPEDKGVSYIEPSIEFMPSYFKGSKFGWSYFLNSQKSKSVLLDYPVQGEKSEVKIDRFSINPNIFYSFGDKFIKRSGGFSFRVGAGLALSYISEFYVKRLATNDIFRPKTRVKYNTSIFVELNWSFLSVKTESSDVVYDGKKFEGLEADSLKLESLKISILYSYYFK